MGPITDNPLTAADPSIIAQWQVSIDPGVYPRRHSLFDGLQRSTLDGGGVMTPAPFVPVNTRTSSSLLGPVKFAIEAVAPFGSVNLPHKKNR